MKSAMEYRNNMLQLVKRHKGAMRMSLHQTVDDIDDWIAQMYDLALHIDSFESNDLVERDRKKVPQDIEATRRRIELETDERVRQDLENKLRQLEQQLTNLDATVNCVKRAEFQLESTLSSVGTIYAQMSLLGTKEVDSARAQRLRLEIQDEVSGLQDTIDAMDEVQSQRLYLR
jgi:predicted RNase H-like nuclease (RuvC/YqgF family)